MEWLFNGPSDTTIMTPKDPMRLVTYCGLYCGLCAERVRVPPQARQLRETMRAEGYDFWHKFVPSMKKTYPTFVKFLEDLSEIDCTCRSGKGGPPDCKMRECAKSRKVKSCPMCDDYPCQHIKTLAEAYPTLIQDGLKMRKLGVKKWIEEQEARARRGFVYADIRYKS